MVDTLRSYGIQTMLSIWPFIDPAAPDFALATTKRLVATNISAPGTPLLLFKNADSSNQSSAFRALWDATNNDTMDLMWQRTQHYRDGGINSFWLDDTEPNMDRPAAEVAAFACGSWKHCGSLWPNAWVEKFSNGVRPQGGMVLARAGWAGQQRTGAAIWSSDIDSSFEALQIQIRAGLSIALSGVPWWTTDIGGFKNGRPATPYFRELIVRWFQYGAFCPIMRLHGYRLPVSHMYDYQFSR
jgi:alpha-D-xyloside xylohydrolase